MADPANFEALQARLRHQGIVTTRCLVLRHVLAEFDPQERDATLGYEHLLARVQTVITAALQEHEREESHA